MGRPIRSLSGTVAGFSPQISHIFFAIASLRLLHNCAMSGLVFGSPLMAALGVRVVLIC
jgi:hypothetical protein